ncbi:hypothetical protein SARC_05647 [Sphaeroforma arctica JP610]|uniref:mRNA cap guanine-N(7) methyltransferase n=1 Tax=Sphaeroforma arctica JP610 TaxID=667725 RepID=A0A0L0G1I3_9EUKA|nr:hypothetical protein SARC_05647 [Sphaeroforma arctica JP610]KNC82053.1 hypothetical protein SARC_05647 [Sphaeroforma arctica JP610]|eukprot:XP_014155955.1 hypothetical protein SARC_05647 [Sphaeroforma arctica JP610]
MSEGEIHGLGLSDSDSDSDGQANNDSVNVGVVSNSDDAKVTSSPEIHNIENVCKVTSSPDIHNNGDVRTSSGDGDNNSDRDAGNRHSSEVSSGNARDKTHSVDRVVSGHYSDGVDRSGRKRQCDEVDDRQTYKKSKYEDGGSGMDRGSSRDRQTQQTTERSHQRVVLSDRSGKRDSTVADLGTVVAQHYNARPDVGVRAREESPIYALKCFNNWLKATMIQKYVRPNMCVLDLCCGKGGDLNKWSKARVGRLVGADIAEVSISHCRQRYSEMRGYKPTAEFHVADCAKLRLRDVYSFKPMFDTVSCQFSFHYAFESEEKAMMMMRNAAECLKPGGVFFGTTTNACLLVKQLRAANGDSFGNDVYNVKFAKDDKKDFPEYGCKYNFSLVDAIDDCPEYLTHPAILTKLAKEHNLELVTYERFHDFFAKYQTDPDAVDRMIRMKVLGRQGTIPRDQWEAIGQYVAFVFRKRMD